MDLALHSWCIRSLIGMSEKTKVQSVLSSALVSTLMALAMTNLNIIASEVLVYSVVLEYLLPIAIHLLLFGADLHRILQSIGALLLVFLLGSGAFSHRAQAGLPLGCKRTLEVGGPCEAGGSCEAGPTRVIRVACVRQYPYDLGPTTGGSTEVLTHEMWDLGYEIKGLIRHALIVQPFRASG